MIEGCPEGGWPCRDSENSSIINTRECCFIFSSLRGPKGNRGMGESSFLLCLANGTSSSFFA